MTDNYATLNATSIDHFLLEVCERNRTFYYDDCMRIINCRLSTADAI